jgi:hypothetical protein
MRDAIALQERALADLRGSREASAAWSDDQRQSLDRQCLEPLEKDARLLLEALRDAGREITAAEGLLTR